MRNGYSHFEATKWVFPLVNLPEIPRCINMSKGKKKGKGKKEKKPKE